MWKICLIKCCEYLRQFHGLVVIAWCMVLSLSFINILKKCHQFVDRITLCRCKEMKFSTSMVLRNVVGLGNYIRKQIFAKRKL